MTDTLPRDWVIPVVDVVSAGRPAALETDVQVLEQNGVPYWAIERWVIQRLYMTEYLLHRVAESRN